jgi:hypothetical protein
MRVLLTIVVLDYLWRRHFEVGGRRWWRGYDMKRERVRDVNGDGTRVGGVDRYVKI